MEYLKKLINDADSAAYRAKKGGGNDIVCANDSCNGFM
jgi:PleD family two-component response regulator